MSCSTISVKLSTLCSEFRSPLKVVIGCAKCWHNVHRWTNVLAHVGVLAASLKSGGCCQTGLRKFLPTNDAGAFATTHVLHLTQAVSVSFYGTVMYPHLVSCVGPWLLRRSTIRDRSSNTGQMVSFLIGRVGGLSRIWLFLS